MRKSIIFILITVFIGLFILGCQVQKLPPPPKAFGGPIGRAAIFYPDWATAPDGKLTLSPSKFTLDAADTATATLTGTDDYVWNTFYVLNNANSWVPLTSTCTPVQNSQWCNQSASVSFTVDLNTFSYGHNFAIGYTCTDLGAGTFDCDGGRWKLLIFDIEQPGVNQAPTAIISSPSTGSSYTQGSIVTFSGSGTDPEDGSVPGAGLTWSSDIDGNIGTGTTVQTAALSLGTHTITLTATDSGNMTGTDIITIDIISTAPYPETCADTTDGGDDPVQKGITVKGNTSLTDACVGTNLVEYYCDNNEIQSKTYVPVDHEICREGKLELRPKVMSVDQCYLSGDDNYYGVDFPSCPGQTMIRALRYYSYNSAEGSTPQTNLWEHHNYGNDCTRKWTLCTHQGIPASITNCATESDSSEGPWVYACEPPACPAGQNSLKNYVLTGHYVQPGSNTYRYINRFNRICIGGGYKGIVISCGDQSEARTCALDCPAGTVEVGVEITDPVIPHLRELKQYDHKNR
ncbi:hypothetical protein GF371_04650, partial [Candidatus Woesearchaeota archaeon]|nr:hypothetical protein [Candidatus Woesearchaeota archaeon]